MDPVDGKTRKGEHQMWLEEMAWLWLPVASGLGLWIIWSQVTLKAEMRILRQRFEAMQAEAASRESLVHRDA
jgi:hypothetical protein